MTNLLKSTLFAASMLFGLGTVASAETLHAKIPFTFSAAGAVMPAGTYSIRPLPGMPAVLMFENEETGKRAMVLVPGGTSPDGTITMPLTVAPEASATRALTSIHTLGGTYQLSLRTAK